MSIGPITDAHKLAYDSNVKVAIQQASSKLTPAFTYQPALIAIAPELLEGLRIVDAFREGQCPENAAALIERFREILNAVGGVA